MRGGMSVVRLGHNVGVRQKVNGTRCLLWTTDKGENLCYIADPTLDFNLL